MKFTGLTVFFLLLTAPSAISAAVIRRIDSVELRGTTRLSIEQIQKAIRLNVDDVVDDNYVSEMRARLLGLGLFQDAIFSLQKVADPTKAKLVITAIDDQSVVGQGALGGEFGLIVTEPERTINDDSPFRSYHLGLIARNLFGNRHRAAINTDVDVKGTLASGSAAYGLPRFAAEAIQFDAMISATDPQYRYLETQAFGMKVQSVWTRSVRLGDVQYGAAWYSNSHRRYRLDVWPEVVAGPKIGFVHETRFLGFLPGDGWRLGASIIPSIVKRGESVAELQLAGTWAPIRHTVFTTGLESTNVGRTGVTTRGELRLDVPITDDRSEGTKALLFTKLRQGYDHYQTASLSGSDAMIGIRYHSTGFIGELAFQITQRNPLAKHGVPDATGEDPIK